MRERERESERKKEGDRNELRPKHLKDQSYKNFLPELIGRIPKHVFLDFDA